MSEPKKAYKHWPQNYEDALGNVQFQETNLRGFLAIEDYNNALVKAEFLVKDLKTLIAMPKKTTGNEAS